MREKIAPASVKLLEKLPRESIRTIPAKPHVMEARKGGRYNVEKTRALNKRIKELAAQGMPRKEISIECGVSIQAVGEHLRGEIKCLKASS